MTIAQGVYLVIKATKWSARVSVVFVALPVMLGCASSTPRATYAIQNFLNDLRAAGANVEVTSDQNIDHGFSAPGRRIVVNDADVYVYEFAGDQQASLAASEVSPDGYNITRTVGIYTTMRHGDWIEPPHFYRRGQVIVIYAGRDWGMRSLLAKLLGSQFAGSETNYRGQ